MAEINPVEFGRLVGLVEGLRTDIAEFKVTHSTKMEDLERRVGAMEQFRAIAVVPTFADKALDKALWGLLIAGLGAVSKFLGVV